MKKRFLSSIIIPVSVIFGASFLFTQQSFALSIEYNKFDVNIEVNSDATFQVTEEISMTFNGKFHGLRRDIPLTNRNCTASNQGTCGGFDLLFLDNVLDEKGNQINDKVQLYSYEDGETYYRVEWEIYPDGRNVSNYNIAWTIQYTVWGGIQWMQDLPRFYWNALPTERGGTIRSSNINFILNDGLRLNTDKFDFLENYVEVSYNSSRASIQLSNLFDGRNVTLAYTFEKNDLELPARLQLNVVQPYFGNNASLNGYIITEFLGREIFLPAGTHDLEVSHIGYQTQIIPINARSGELIKKDVALEPEFFMQILIVLNNVFWLITPILVASGAYLVYITYRAAGVDKYRRKVIIPLFSPPINFSVALTNSIINEKYSNRDLSATIIKLAVDGYIKVENIKNKVKLFRTEKSPEALEDEIDFLVLTKLFASSKEVNVSVPSTSLQKAIREIESAIEKRVNKEGYFKVNPKIQITKYLGIGFLSSVLGGSSLLFTGILMTMFIGYFSTIHLVIINLVYGLGILVIAKHMPAKSEEGSRLEAELLGFKMYLHTAERFRLEDQKVDEFEKYLAYAVALGVEKAWADRFSDLKDNLKVDWYQGDPFTLDRIYLLSKTMDTSLQSIRTYSPQASVSGSGWSSSSSSFSSFSGGGGGGGRSGGW